MNEFIIGEIHILIWVLLNTSLVGKTTNFNGIFSKEFGYWVTWHIKSGLSVKIPLKNYTHSIGSEVNLYIS